MTKNKAEKTAKKTATKSQVITVELLEQKGEHIAGGIIAGEKGKELNRAEFYRFDGGHWIAWDHSKPVQKITERELLIWSIKLTTMEPLTSMCLAQIEKDDSTAKAQEITPEFLEANAEEIHNGETDWGDEEIYLFEGQYYGVEAHHTWKGERMPVGAISYSQKEYLRMKHEYKVVKLNEDQMFRAMIDQSFLGVARTMMLNRLARK
jgi:hypothetical protein